jgi:hypothetical protein
MRCAYPLDQLAERRMDIEVVVTVEVVGGEGFEIDLVENDGIGRK